MMELRYRHAVESDLPVLIAMLADDQLGQQREDASEPVNPAYRHMLDLIQADANNQLMVVQTATGSDAIVGMMQLTYIPYLTYTGSWRCLIEGVRVHKDYRGLGIGRQMFTWAIEQARQKACAMVQLTSNKSRHDALRFYESLGFSASHEGFKLHLH